MQPFYIGSNVHNSLNYSQNHEKSLPLSCEIV